MVEERNGKKKKQLVKASHVDPRKFPHFLQDGDIIGVRLGSDDLQKTDDLQTDADIIAKADFNLLKEKQQKALA